MQQNKSPLTCKHCEGTSKFFAGQQHCHDEGTCMTNLSRKYARTQVHLDNS